MPVLILWAVAAAIGVAVGRGWSAGIDAVLLQAVAGWAREADWPIAPLIAATVIGSAVARLPLAGATAAAIAWRGDRHAAAAIVAAAVGMWIGNAALKQVAGRVRPDLLPHLAIETSLSFPSGHAANAAAVFPTIAWAMVRAGAPSRIVWPAAILLVMAVGASRVVLGVHWPSDVVAGWCVGTGWMLLCVAITQAIQHRGGGDAPR